MLLYLMRHGLAEHTAPSGSDFDRDLTNAGVKRLELQARALHALGLRVDRLLTSPRVRAARTAALIADAVGAVPVEASELGGGCRVEDVALLSETHGRPRRLLLVGHQPDLSTLIYRLTEARVPMQPGMLAAVETAALRAGRGTLAGLYPPDVLMQLGIHLVST